jgi:beta-glucanase (GH16 family)
MPDARTWRPDSGDGCARGICGWGNQERQWYTGDAANASMNGRGQLVITARAAASSRSCWYGPCRYTSGKWITKGRAEPGFGRVAVRARVPKGQGLWPAFWMLGATYPDTAWPASGEIDVMEFKGSTPTGSSSALHGPGYSGNTPLTRRWDRDGVDLSRGFHVYAVERDSATIRFLVDDVEHYRVSRSEVERYGRWVFDGPFYLLLNLAVGGGFDGDPASDKVLPASMLVDWVRVYRRR